MRLVQPETLILTTVLTTEYRDSNPDWTFFHPSRRPCLATSCLLDFTVAFSCQLHYFSCVLVSVHIDFTTKHFYRKLLALIQLAVRGPGHMSRAVCVLTVSDGCQKGSVWYNFPQNSIQISALVVP